MVKIPSESRSKPGRRHITDLCLDSKFGQFIAGAAGDRTKSTPMNETHRVAARAVLMGYVGPQDSERDTVCVAIPKEHTVTFMQLHCDLR
jgi:hypothetical protein